MKTKQQSPLLVRRRNAMLLRAGIQLAFFLLAPSAFSSAFSGIKEICTAFSQGAELELTSFAKILLLLCLFTVVFGRFFCGYACAFGAIGDWIYALAAKIAKKTGKKLPTIPERFIGPAQYVKYAVLVLIVILCVAGQQQMVNGNSPWTIFSFLSSFHMPKGSTVISILLFIAIVCGMALHERFFCQFLCPMGAVFSLLPVLPLGQLRRDRDTCAKGCSACSRVCPVDLELEEESIHSGECIRCNRCVELCPKHNISIDWIPLSGNEPAWVVLQAAALLIGLWFI